MPTTKFPQLDRFSSQLKSVFGAWEANLTGLTKVQARDDLARTALERIREHVDAAEWLEAERQLVESMCESLDETIARLRATLASD